MTAFLGMVAVGLIAAMVWDQRRLGSMYWWKWPIALLMLGIFEIVIWLR